MRIPVDWLSRKILRQAPSDLWSAFILARAGRGTALHGIKVVIIPTDVSHDRLAQFRWVIEAIWSGMARRSFQALQQASTMAS